MSEKHTPGPWAADRLSCFVFAHDSQMMVCEIRGWGFLTGSGGLRLPEDEAVAIQAANAALISAAPDLLEALKAVVHRTEMGTALFCKLTEEHAEAALAAIAKAEGR